MINNIPLTKIMPKLSDLYDICLIEVSDITIHNAGPHGQICEITLPEETRVAVSNGVVDLGNGYESTPRKELEQNRTEWFYKQMNEYRETEETQIATQDNPFRFSAGGALGITTDGYFVFIERDQGAPTYKGYLTAATGLSENMDAIYDPSKIVAHELQEELTLLDEDGNICVWKHEGMSDEDYALMEELAKLRAEKTELDYSGIIPHEVTSIDIGSENTYILIVKNSNGDELSRNKGIVNFDPATSGIDFLNIVKLDFSYEDVKSGKYRVVDTETFGGNNRTERNIVYVHKDELLNSSTKSISGIVYNHWTGTKSKEKEFDREMFTPVANEMINAYM
ncbi:hypothetical protein GQ473_04955 [archaeon]|nr:hypothetical protein [archaeon]